MYEWKNVTAIAEVLPEGQKVTAFALEYDREISPEEAEKLQFEIVDHSLEPELAAAKRGIIRIYTSSRPEKRQQGEAGKYVIVETDASCKEAYTIINYTYKGEQNIYGPGSLGYGEPGGAKPGMPMKPPAPGGPTAKMDYTGFKNLRYTIRQIPAEKAPFCAEEKVCTRSVCHETERFWLFHYEGFFYNLFIPDNYTPDQKYPLVVFIPDASARSTDPKIPLVQGIGGVIWSRPEEQKKHPCFVLCPVFAPEELLTRDDFSCIPRLYEIRKLIDHVAQEYAVDKRRIYTTGQSMGCMASCELMCTYPDYFAGAILVAGQWDPVGCGKTMCNKPLWILVSANDKKAHPGMDAVTAAIEEQGGTVARDEWDAKAGEEELNRCAKEMIKTDANVKYTLFCGDSVVPDGEHPGPGSNHTCTWRTAYQISEVRDWLFTNINEEIRDEK